MVFVDSPPHRVGRLMAMIVLYWTSLEAAPLYHKSVSKKELRGESTAFYTTVVALFTFALATLVAQRHTSSSFKPLQFDAWI